MTRRLAPLSLFVASTLTAVVAFASVAPRTALAAPRLQFGQPQRVAPTIVNSAADTLLALHVLNRLTFGPRPGDVGRVLETGISSWIEHQLQPDSALDKAAITALSGCDLWTQPVGVATGRLSGRETFPYMSNGVMRSAGIIGGGLLLLSRDSAQKITANPSGGLALANAQLLACRLARLEASDWQLLEVMTDFWENHFSIHGAKLPVRGFIIEYDRAVIRPNALGNFRALLGAVAHSPAMQAYLDNAVNSADSARATLVPFRSIFPRIGQQALVVQRPGLNENYARELLELHTLGVDGGYTQADVIDVARALTGWSHSLAVPGGDELAVFRMITMQSPSLPPAPATFVFDSSRHDSESKVVLGARLAAGRGIADGEDVLDILARHPATARFIARKLAVRFLSDTPPEALIDRAAATFIRTDGNIREVLYTIFTSAEFLSSDAFGAKVKSPLEFVVSLRRALAAPVDTAAECIDLLLRLDQPPFGRFSPDGWPETGQAWMNVGAMSTRMDIVTKVVRDEMPSIPVTAWPQWTALSAQPFDVQLSGVMKALLNGRVSESTSMTLAAARPTAGMSFDAESRQRALRELIALALGSPEFQRR